VNLNCKLFKFKSGLTFNDSSSLLLSNYEEVVPNSDCFIIPGNLATGQSPKIKFNTAEKIQYNNEYKLYVNGINAPLTFSSVVHSKFSISIEDFNEMSTFYHIGFKVREPFIDPFKRITGFNNSVILYSEQIPFLLSTPATDPLPLVSSNDYSTNVSASAKSKFNVGISLQTNSFTEDLLKDHHYIIIEFSRFIGSADVISVDAANQSAFEVIPLTSESFTSNFMYVNNKPISKLSVRNFAYNFSSKGESLSPDVSLLKSMNALMVSDYDTSQGSDISSTDVFNASQSNSQYLLVKLLEDISSGSGLQSFQLNDFMMESGSDAIDSSNMSIYVCSPSQKLAKITNSISIQPNLIPFDSISVSVDRTVTHVKTGLNIFFAIDYQIEPGNFLIVTLPPDLKFYKGFKDSFITSGYPEFFETIGNNPESLTYTQNDDNLLLSDILPYVISPSKNQMAIRFISKNSPWTFHSLDLYILKSVTNNSSQKIDVQLFKSSSSFENVFDPATTLLPISEVSSNTVSYSGQTDGILKLFVSPVGTSYPLQSQDLGPLKFYHEVANNPIDGSLHDLRVNTFANFPSSYTQDIYCSINDRVVYDCLFHMDGGDETQGYYLLQLRNEMQFVVGSMLVIKIFPQRQEISYLRKNYFKFPEKGDHTLEVAVVDKALVLVSSQRYIMNVKPSRLHKIDYRVLSYEANERSIWRFRLINWLNINTSNKGRYLISVIIKDRNTNIVFNEELSIEGFTHNLPCKHTYNRSDGLFTYDSDYYSSFSSTQIPKGTSDFECYSFKGHSTYHTENINWVLEPTQPLLPFSEVTFIINQLLNPSVDNYEAVVEIKGQNFDKISKEWVTDHFEKKLLFIAQDRKDPLKSFKFDRELVLSDGA
jgi:hypothetical protein